MHFEALLGFDAFTAGFVASRLLPITFDLAADLLTGVGLAAPLREQCLFEQRLSITNEPHSQNSANGITPFSYTALKFV